MILNPSTGIMTVPPWNQIKTPSNAAHTAAHMAGSTKWEIGGPGNSTTAGNLGTYSCGSEAHKVLLLRQLLAVGIRALHDNVFLNLLIRINVVAVDLVVLIVT